MEFGAYGTPYRNPTRTLQEPYGIRWGRSGSIFGGSQGPLGGPLGINWRPWEVQLTSAWANSTGPSWLPLGSSWLPRALSWVPLGSSWEPLGCLLGPLGCLSGPLGNLLATSWVLVATPTAVPMQIHRVILNPSCVLALRDRLRERLREAYGKLMGPDGNAQSDTGAPIILMARQ